MLYTLYELYPSSLDHRVLDKPTNVNDLFTKEKGFGGDPRGSLGTAAMSYLCLNPTLASYSKITSSKIFFWPSELLIPYVN